MSPSRIWKITLFCWDIKRGAEDLVSWHTHTRVRNTNYNITTLFPLYFIYAAAHLPWMLVRPTFFPQLSIFIFEDTKLKTCSHTHTYTYVFVYIYIYIIRDTCICINIPHRWFIYTCMTMRIYIYIYICIVTQSIIPIEKHNICCM